MTEKEIDNLIERVLQGKHTDHIWQDIVDRIYAGSSALKLRPLFQSPNALIVRHAAWVLSEIGVASKELLDDCRRLIDSEDGATRFWALDVVLINASEQNIELIIRGVECIWDRDSGVAWKALWFLTRLSDDVVILASKSQKSSSRVRDLLYSIIKSLEISTLPDLSMCLKSESYDARAVAAIVCARRQKEYVSCLQAIATESGDPIARFAFDNYADYQSSRKLN